MFPKVNKKNSGKQPEIEAKSEVDAESDRGSIQAVGNEGMNNLLNTSFDPGMLRIPDEDNEIELDGPEVFGGGRKSSGSGSDDQNNDLLNSGSNLNNNNINNNNNANRNKIDKAHKKEEEINRADDPAEVIEKAPDDVIDELMDEVEEENPDLDLSMIAERPKRKKGKGGKGGNQANRRADIRNVSDDMKPAEGFNFHAIKLPKRKRSGTGDRFLSGLAWYSGKTIGRLLSAIGNALYWGLGYLPHKLYNKIKGKKTKERISPSEFQKTRQHDQVPGWNGKKFQKQIQGERVANDPIEVDFRKIPGVWAQMTAGQAEDENGDPLDPIITVYVAEPKEQSDDTTAHRDIGHTFIGLEFSHFSKVTNHFERYITRYGLFAPGANNASSYIAGYYQNATIPAQLLNDKNYSYDISRSFPAKPEQVNDIMKASETYADRGYRLFDRNCTTFVKEMVVDIAHIREAEHILNPEEILMDHTLNAGMFASIMLSPNASLGMKHIFGEMAAQDDMSYERIGNKRVTKEEYDRFKETRFKGQDYVKFGQSPNSAAENMRRFKSNDIGFVGAQAFSGNLDLKNGFSLHDLPSAYLSEAMKVNLLIRRITPQPLLNPATAPDEFSRIFGGMMVYMEPIGKIADLIDKEYENKGLTQPQPPEKYDCVTPKLLRDKRAELMKNIGELNKLLIKYYQNDKRVHLPILHLISLLNRGVERIDEDLPE